KRSDSRPGPDRPWSWIVRPRPATSISQPSTPRMVMQPSVSRPRRAVPPVKPCNLTNVTIGAKAGVLAEMRDPTDYNLRLEALTFRRFAGDTVTGRCGGVLWAERK